MSRKLLAGLIGWLLLAFACGGDDPAPTASVTAATSGTTTVTAAAEAGPETGAVDTTGEAPAQPAGESPTDTAPADTGSAAAPNTSDGSSTGEESSSETTAGPPIDEESTTETTEGTQAPSTTAYSGPVSPVTGLPVEDVDLLDRRLVAVKVDNHWRAQPQSGIEDADAVYELVVEGGLTRFIALYHHSDSEWVGPMRSARPTDWTLVRPLEGVLLISGGQSWIVRRLTSNGVPLIGDLGPPLTARWGERRAPHNLYVDTYEARRVTADRGYGRTAPPSLFNRGPLSGSGATASYVFFDWSDEIDVVWRWDGTRYLRSSDGEPQLWRNREGDETAQIEADVLIVLMAERYTACPPGEGSCVPAWNTVGENRAIVFGEGRYAEGRWSRDSADDWFRITDPGGEPITVPPGRLWIMIYPETANLVW